jgi:hypothetical protein
VPLTNTDRARAEKKVEIAIDKMVDLQDMGLGSDSVTRILEALNHLLNQIRNAP